MPCILLHSLNNLSACFFAVEDGTDATGVEDWKLVGEEFTSSGKSDNSRRRFFNVDRGDLYHRPEQSTRPLGVATGDVATTATTLAEGLWSEEHGSLCLREAKVGLSHSLLHPEMAILVLRIVFAVVSIAAAIALSLRIGRSARRQR